MRKLIYSVAASFDGYIAGPDGEYDWIPEDPEIDFVDIFQQFDTLVMGRGTFMTLVAQGQTSMPGSQVVVFSKSLEQTDYPDVEVCAGSATERVMALKQLTGKDIWLYGGGALFRSMLQAGMVDEVHVAVIPILLGSGIPLLPSYPAKTKLRLLSHHVYGSGIVMVKYSVA